MIIRTHESDFEGAPLAQQCPVFSLLRVSRAREGSQVATIPIISVEHFVSCQRTQIHWTQRLAKLHFENCGCTLKVSRERSDEIGCREALEIRDSKWRFD